MSSIITKSDVSKIETHLLKYEAFLKSDDGKRHHSKCYERHTRYSSLFSPEKIDSLSEADLATVISELWANALWTNKQYVVNRVLKNNDLNTLKSAFKDLIWGDDPLRNRFERFFKSVRYVGPSQATEIMCFVRPKEYAIWNEVSRRALKMLGLDRVLPLDKYTPSGEEYERFIEVCREILALMQSKGLGSSLLDVDMFFFYMVLVKPRGEESVETIVEGGEDYEFDHDEVKEKLVGLGAGLGFETESEVLIAPGARVDVVWRARIGNLGMVNYVFEVQGAGSIDSAILNLMRAKSNPTVQKLIVVSNKKWLKRMEDEVSTLPEDFRKLIVYMEAKDVLEASELLRRLNEILQKLELVKRT